MRMSGIRLFAFVLLLAAAHGAGAVDVVSKLDQETDFDIAPQALDAALLEFGRQADLQLMFAASDFGGKKTSGVQGRMSVEQALSALLQDTGLVYQEMGDKTVTVKPARGAAREEGANEDGVRLAQAETSSGAADTQEDSAGGKLEEVVVTAQKRVERLQDVPVPVTAIGGDTLAQQNQLRLQEYYTRVPGLNLTLQDSRGAPNLSIRGLTTGGFTNPTIGIVVDDVPYGSSTDVGGGSLIPDIDPSELARIEVLRGPQGTLYGASSIGGLLKYVTVDPSTDGVTGRLQAGTNSVRNGDNFGYNLRGAVNVPLSDTFAVRASAFIRRDPGYIDDPGLGKDGVNQVDVNGGRLSTLWRPSETLSLKLSALIQDSEADGSSAVHALPGLGDLQQRALLGTGQVDRKSQIYNATLTSKLGRAELIAVSGYSINDLDAIFDFTFAFGPITQDGVPGSGFDGFGVAGTPLFEQYETNKFTQEIRLSMPIGEKLEWLLGTFYTDEDSMFHNDLLGVDPATGATGPVAGSLLHTDNPNTFSEYALFTDLTFHFTDRFDVQIGGRQSRNRQSNQSTQIGPGLPVFGLPNPNVSDTVRSEDNSFTYLVTPRFRMSPDLMLYARLASGYRVGGPNINFVPGVPSEYGPDTTQNYEMGIKGNILDDVLSFDASVYYIHWKDVQIQLNDPTTSAAFVDNGSRARSQGVELSMESRPISGLTIAAWVAWNDAELSDNFPDESSAVGDSGDRLPYSTKFSGHVSVNKEFPLTSTFTGFVGGSWSYAGERQGVFSSVFLVPPRRQIFPAYARTDIRAGVSHESWAVNFFVTNVADKRGLLSGGLGTTAPFAFNYIQPRTFGVSLSKSFKH